MGSLLSHLAGATAVACVLTTCAGTVPASAQDAVVAESSYERVLLTAGRSVVLRTDFEITRVAVTNPAVADAVVVQPTEILVDGKGAGTVSLIVWGASQRKQYDVVVDAGVPPLQQQLAALFPGEDIKVAFSDGALILSGRVSSNGIMLRAGEIAEAAHSKSRVINLLQLPSGSESQQVMLQVRVAEVNRRAITELGVNFFLTKPNWLGRVTTQQFTAPNHDDFTEQGVSGLTFSDFLNLFVFARKDGIGAVVKALQGTGYFQTLAEPNLIAYNGKEASFLAGGEYPIPVVQGATGTVTIVYREYGVRLTFLPIIAGDVIRLKVTPEVSALDFNNGITLSGFRVPALTTRRAQTEVELRDGQSFAIAGLLNNTSQTDKSAIPFLSAIPVIGTLFKSKADRQEQTELMVLVTPRLVRPLDPDEVPAMPTQPGAFLPAPGSGTTEEVLEAPPIPPSPAKPRLN